MSGQIELDYDTRFRHAMLLYEKRAYIPARSEFSKISSQKYVEEVTYYIASCAVKASQDDGEYLIREFVRNYPYHPYAQNAFFELGNHYFDQGRFSEAIDVYKKIEETYSTELFFKTGYAFFQIEQYDSALVSFNKLEDSYTDYEKDAAYFMGYIYYHQGQVEDAFKYLETGFESAQFGDASIELYVSALYLSKNYEQLIRLVEEQNMQEANLIVLNLYADAYYALGNYEAASKNYTSLFEKYPDSRNEKNYYKSGYSNYQLDDNLTAEDQLKRAAVADDTVGAYASYYLGVLYYEEGNLPFASTSFENTAKYETRLKEDALLRLCQSLIETPNYSRAIEESHRYQSEFPNGKYLDEIGEMLGISYAMTDNYDLAMEYIESRSELTPRMKATYQRVSFMKGMSLFNDKKFPYAIQLFEKSLIHSVDPEITQNSFYWCGESLSLIGKEDESLFHYRSLRDDNSTLYLKSIYSKAYAYFNLKQYEDAKVEFLTFIERYNENAHSNYLADAYLRLGDCYFVSKEYREGIANYEKALDAGHKNKGKAYFQMGLLYRYLSEDEMARDYFKKLIDEVPGSSKIDHASYQIAKMKYESGDAENAIISYSKFQSDYPGSSFLPYAILEQAVAYENTGQVKLSVENYKEVLDRFPRHETAKSALLGLQQISNNGGFDQFDSYLSKYKSANPDSEALENIEFETAQSMYYNQKYKKAVATFKDFLNQYPSSPLALNAKYFIADSYFRMEESKESLDAFYALKNESDFSKYSKVLHRIATLEASFYNFKESNAYFHKMSNYSSRAKDVRFVKRGLMENHFMLKNYDSTLYYSILLIDQPGIDISTDAHAKLLAGKSLFYQSKLDEALTYLSPLVTESPNETGAEAQLYMAKVSYKRKTYDRALEELFLLTKEFQNYDYWQGEAFLMMSDIYLETDEVFQAKATLNSLIEHAQNAEIKQRAEKRLKDIDHMTYESN